MPVHELRRGRLWIARVVPAFYRNDWGSVISFLNTAWNLFVVIVVQTIASSEQRQRERDRRIIKAWHWWKGTDIKLTCVILFFVCVFFVRNSRSSCKSAVLKFDFPIIIHLSVKYFLDSNGHSTGGEKPNTSHQQHGQLNIMFSSRAVELAVRCSGYKERWKQKQIPVTLVVIKDCVHAHTGFIHQPLFLVLQEQWSGRK